MKQALQSIRNAQWRWDFAVAFHRAVFHTPVEIARFLNEVQPNWVKKTQKKGRLTMKL